MKIIKQKKIEGCLEGSNVRDFLLDEKIKRDFISYLGKLGKLIYHKDMDRPYFKVIIKGKYTIKGSQGNFTVRLLLPEKNDDEFIKEFVEYVEKWVSN